MNEKKIILITVFVSILVIVTGVFLIGKISSPMVSASQNAKAYTIDPTSYDWGDIDYNGGIVAKIFTIKNTGSGVLSFSNIRTSCHCTKARMIIGGKTSPDFGMSGVSSWIGNVDPGKEAKLEVLFDPAFHGPQGVGAVNRFVSVETNDASNPKLTFTLTGTVVQ